MVVEEEGAEPGDVEELTQGPTASRGGARAPRSLLLPQPRWVQPAGGLLWASSPPPTPSPVRPFQRILSG